MVGWFGGWLVCTTISGAPDGTKIRKYGIRAMPNERKEKHYSWSVPAPKLRRGRGLMEAGRWMVHPFQFFLKFFFEKGLRCICACVVIVYVIAL